MGVRQTSFEESIMAMGATTKTTLFPSSHKFQAQFSLLRRATKTMAFKENYWQPA